MEWGESEPASPADDSDEYDSIASYEDENDSFAFEARHCLHCADVRARIIGPHQLTWRECQDLFHRPCPCDDAAADAQEDQHVCAFCRHLRLRHLIVCPGEEDKSNSQADSLDSLDDKPSPQLPYWKYLSLGLTKEVVERAVQRSHCTSCRFWAALAARSLPDFPDQPFIILSQEFSMHFLTATTFLGKDFRTGVEMDVNIQSLPGTSESLGAPLRDGYPKPVSQRIDWSRVAGWIRTCCQDHEKCLPKETRDLPAQFRVIDVQERKLVRPTLPCRYVALSYVWGVPKKPMATRSNIKMLEEPGSLQPSIVPQTVLDAMTVCEKLSERYLWADCLCIMQDDPGEKRDQIRRMAGIYMAAEAVLVVASGDSMDQAIPGVSVDRPERIQGEFLGLRLTQSHFNDPWDTLQSTTWATRGWTYQEGILPSRNLYIMDQEVWFECGESVIREDPYAEHAEYMKEGSRLARTSVASWLGALHLPDRDDSDPRQPWDSYTWHLPRYTTRSLSDDRDIFNAFSGILNPLFDGHGGTTFGIPVAEFDRALLWRNMDHNTLSSLRPGVPSWSWGSMRGHTYIDGLNDWIGTLARWSQYSESEEAFVERSTHRNQWHHQRRVGNLKNATFLAIAWTHGLVEKPCPRELDHRSVWFDELNQVATERWPSPRDFGHEALDKVELDQYASLDVRKADILCGRAQTAVLKIMLDDSDYSGRCKWKCRHAENVG